MKCLIALVIAGTLRFHRLPFEQMPAVARLSICFFRCSCSLEALTIAPKRAALWSAVACDRFSFSCDGRVKWHCRDSSEAACTNLLPLANDCDAVSHDRRKNSQSGRKRHALQSAARPETIVRALFMAQQGACYGIGP